MFKERETFSIHGRPFLSMRLNPIRFFSVSFFFLFFFFFFPQCNSLNSKKGITTHTGAHIGHVDLVFLWGHTHAGWLAGWLLQTPRTLGTQKKKTRREFQVFFIHSLVWWNETWGSLAQPLDSSHLFGIDSRKKSSRSCSGISTKKKHFRNIFPSVFCFLTPNRVPHHLLASSSFLSSTIFFFSLCRQLWHSTHTHTPPTYYYYY